MQTKILFTLFFLSFFTVTRAQETFLGGCDITFELGDEITLCSSVSIYPLSQGNPSGGSYSGTGVLDDFFFPSIAGPGEHLITYTFDDGICSGSAIDTIRVVSPIPIGISGDLEICRGESTTVTALNVEDIEWETGSNELSETFSPLITTDYAVYGFDENGCLSATSYQILVHQLPQVEFIGDTSICIGETAIIHVTGAVSYVWDFEEEIDSIVVAPLNETTYYLQATDEFGCVNSDSVTVTVHQYPVVQITGDLELCAGEMTTLLATGADEYLWYTNETGATIDIQPSIEMTAEVVGTTVHGCSTASSADVIVHELPEVVISGDEEGCGSHEITLTASGAVDYVWNDESVGTTFIQEIDEDAVFSVTGTDEFGCQDTDTLEVIVFPLPDLETPVSTGFCAGDTVGLYFNGAYDYTWILGDEIFITDTIDVVLESGGSVIEYYSTNDYGCSSPNQVYTIPVLDYPQLSFLAPDGICPGDSAELIITGSDDIVWESGETSQSIVVSPTQTSSYTATGNNNGCVSAVSYELMVYSLPEVVIEGSDSLCKGAPAMLSASGATEYQWDTQALTAEIEVSIFSDTTFTVIGIDDFGCSDTTSFNMVVLELPELELTGDPAIVCPGDTVALSVSGALQYEWNGEAVESPFNVNPEATTDYTVIGTDENGCSNEITLTVMVNELEEIDFTLATDTICDNGSLILEASPAGGVFSGDGVNGNSFNPTTGNWGQNEITYTYEDEMGCIAMASAQIFVDDCTSIEESFRRAVEVYPNPFHETLNVVGNQAISSIFIYDISGGLIEFIGNLNASTVSIAPELSAGIYHMVIQFSDGGLLAKRVTRN